MKVYLASRHQDRELMRQWRSLLIDRRHEVVSRWLNDDFWCLDDDVLMAQGDLEDVFRSDIVVVNSLPQSHNNGSGGRHVEFGYALAHRKPVILVGERENVFHALPSCRLTSTIEGAVALIELYEDTGIWNEAKSKCHARLRRLQRQH